MGRAAKFSDEDVLTAALAVFAEHGPMGTTAVAIAARMGAPSGSIYHRFPSRDFIMARLWIKTIKNFQEGFLASFRRDETEAIIRQAVSHTLDWSRKHAIEARVLLLYRREDLIARWPDELGAELKELNNGIKAVLRTFTEGHFGAFTSEGMGRTRLALVELPYAAARQHLIEGTTQPAWLTGSVLAAAHAVLQLTDEPR
ncbi:TetR/AcrR family transcriptional regulator [Paenarthrobacter sp. NPDC090517]|uniref:TetR/AcrR family transcriptional regulator n=1 Tax=Paenarthrobacter sp. NPDC090517 TaxID=3364381 RepID=UPI00382E7FFC